MSWLDILKDQQILPTRTSSLALVLSDEKAFEELLSKVESADSLNPAGVSTAESWMHKEDFLKNQFVKIFSQKEGVDVEQMWDRMQSLLEVIRPKMGRVRTTREKLIEAAKTPEEYKDFIAQLKKKPLTEEEIRRLESPRAKEAYRKIMEEVKEEEKGYTLRFNFRAGEGVSKRQFETALDLLASSEKITRKGNDLVFDTDRAEGVRQLLLSDDRFRPNYDQFLRGFMQRLPKGEKIALPKTTLPESMSVSLLTDKKYTPKSDLARADFMDYLEVIEKSNVPVAKYLPLSRGPNKGIADEVYLASGRIPTLSPYGSLVLMSDFGDNWKEDFFGNVKLSSVFSRSNAEQAIVTDILETLKATPENQRQRAELYGTISLAPFANINLEKKTKKKTATQNARDSILKVIRGSAKLSDMFSTQSKVKQRNMVGQMQEDPTLLTISEAKVAKKKLGGEIVYYDSSLKELDDAKLIASTGLYARLKKNNQFVNRNEISSEELGQREAEMVQQIQNLLESPTSEESLADIVFDLVAQDRIQNVLRRGGKNRLEQTSVENGLVFLLEMAEQYDDSSLKEALDKAILLGKGSREQFKEMGTSKRMVRGEIREALNSIDENMPKTLESYKNGMLEALSVKLAEIGQDYEKFIGQNPQGIESVIRNLLGKGLLEE